MIFLLKFAEHGGENGLAIPGEKIRGLFLQEEDAERHRGIFPAPGVDDDLILLPFLGRLPLDVGERQGEAAGVVPAVAGIGEGAECLAGGIDRPGSPLPETP